ncbi:MAG: hypothetical protein ACON31_11650 [Candidatus Puniceispirillaceae bacterium]
MEVVLKIIHYFSILFAGGVMVGSAVIQSAYVRAGEAPPPHIGKAFALLGYIGLASITLLWVTGIGLSHLIYGGLGINGAFHAKLLGAAIVLGISITANLHVHRSMKAKRPPNPALMKRLVQGGRVGLLLAICGAAVAFSG